MSVDATIATWKLGKEVTAIQKLLLLSIADRAGESGECWPSIKRLEVDTNINRKTIIENRQILIEKKLIRYTGEFKGKQKQIPVMQLMYISNREGSIDFEIEENFTSTEINTGKLFTSTEIGTGTSTENGTLNLKEEPKRNTTSSVDNFSVKEKPKTPLIKESIIDERTDAKLLAARVGIKDGRSNDEFLKQAKYHIDNGDKSKYTQEQRIAGVIACLKRGEFKTPIGYVPEKKSTPQTQNIDIAKVEQESRNKFLKMMEAKKAEASKIE